MRFDGHAEMPAGLHRGQPSRAGGGARRGERRRLVADRGQGALGTGCRRGPRLALRNGKPAAAPPAGAGDGTDRRGRVALRRLARRGPSRHGGWDERFLRNQDFELSYRLRRAGGRLVFDPAISSVYRPRESLRAIARQYWDYGRFKALAFTTSPGSIRPRQLAPIALLATALISLAPGRIGRPARAAMGLYAAILGAVTARSGAAWRTFPVLLTMHFAWGAALVLGLGRRALARVPGGPRTDV